MGRKKKRMYFFLSNRIVMYYGLLTKMNGVMGYRKRSRIDNCLFISYLHDKLPFMLLRIRVSNNFGDKHGLYKTPLLYPYLSFGYTIK